MDELLKKLRIRFPNIKIVKEFDTGSLLVHTKTQGVRIAYQSFKKLWEDYETGESGSFSDSEIAQQKIDFYEQSKRLINRNINQN